MSKRGALDHAIVTNVDPSVCNISVWVFSGPSTPQLSHASLNILKDHPLVAHEARLLQSKLLQPLRWACVQCVGVDDTNVNVAVGGLQQVATRVSI